MERIGGTFPLRNFLDPTLYYATIEAATITAVSIMAAVIYTVTYIVAALCLVYCDI